MPRFVQTTNSTTQYFSCCSFIIAKMHYLKILYNFTFGYKDFEINIGENIL